MTYGRQASRHCEIKLARKGAKTQRGKLCFPTSSFDFQRLAVYITRRGGQTRFYSWGYDIRMFHELPIQHSSIGVQHSTLFF
jgi:hypothetical protein